MNPASLAGHILELLHLTESTRNPPDRLFSTFVRERHYLGSKDRRTLSTQFYGIIRHRRYVEALVEEYLSQHPAHATIDEPVKRHLTLLTAFQILLEPDDRLAVPESQWKERFPEVGMNSFVDWVASNADLAFLGNDELVRLGVRYSFQDWMVSEWKEEYEGRTESLLASLNTPAPVAIRVNTLKTTREDLRELLSREGIESDTSPHSKDALILKKRFNAPSSPAFVDGLFEMQDVGSQMVSLLASPKRGMTVIDACAGAGGKSLHLASLMDNDGEIVAIDVDAGRLRELSRRSARSGAAIIKPILREELAVENFIGKSDIVLVDAPCSGSGTIRRSPWLKWNVTEDLVAHYAKMQGEILEFNSRLVRSGGLLVYATCSLFRKENEDVVKGFLAANSSFRNVTEEITPITGGAPDGSLCHHLLPHVHDTDGFGISLLRRSA